MNSKQGKRENSKEKFEAKEDFIDDEAQLNLCINKIPLIGKYFYRFYGSEIR